jgi:predicted MFS family arabinose efflux permease
LSRRGPLADSYLGAVALVVLALVPFLLLTSAVLPLAQDIAKTLGLSKPALDLVIALSDASYAFGTVLAVQFAVHLRQRRMLLVYASGFVVASAAAAWSPDGPVFMVAFVLQGLCTSLMLIAAVPPLVTGWPPSKMPVTAMVMDLCIFGAVAVGPSVGGLQASAHQWRPLFWIVAGLGVAALAMALLTFEDDGPADQDAPWDVAALGLAAVGCAAAFFGAGRLEDAEHLSPLSLGPLVVGVVLIVGLVVHQYRGRRPLMPVKQLASTFPVAGLVIALFSSSAAVGLMDLLLTKLLKTSSPGHTALLFLPEFGAALVIAVVFGALFRTRYTPVLAVGGLVVLAGAAALATQLLTGPHGALTALDAGLIGIGVGASVSPALFLAGFSLRSAQIQRVFALIELLRGVTAFLVAPVLIFVVANVGSSTLEGTKLGVWICFALAVAGTVFAVAVLRHGRARLQVPDLKRWQEDGEPAWVSPPLRAPEKEEGRRDEEAESVSSEERAGVGSN